MSDDQEEELLDSSTSEGADNDDSPPSPEDAADTGSSSASESQEVRKPKSESREELIKSLTQHSKGEDDEEDEEPESAEDEKSEEEPKGETESKTEESEETEVSKHDTSDKRSKAKERFAVLTNHNKELKGKLDEQAPFADYGRKVLDFCKESGVSTQDMGVALALIATVKKDPAAAATYLDKLGIKPREVVRNVKEVPTELDDKILEMVTEGHMTPEGAKALLGMTRAARVNTPPAAEKPKETQPAQTAKPPAAPTFADPGKADYDRAVAKAVVDIDTKAAEYATKYPADWAKLAPRVTKAMEEYQGTHPSKWIKFFEAEVAKAVATIAKPAKPPVAAGQSLRPSTTNTGVQKAKPTGRKALIADLVAGRAG